jgi:hypothetical protein
MLKSSYYDSDRTETMAPPSSGISPSEPLGRKRKRYFHKAQWGSMPRKASHRVMKQAMYRREFGMS